MLPRQAHADVHLFTRGGQAGPAAQRGLLDLAHSYLLSVALAAETPSPFVAGWYWPKGDILRLAATDRSRCRTDSRTYAPALPQRQCTDQGCSCVQERRRAESTTNPAPNFCTKGVLMPSRAAASSANRPPRRAGEASPNRRLMTSSNFWGSVQTGAVHTSAT